MKSLGLELSSRDAERIRLALREEGILRSGLKVVHADGAVIFPIVRRPDKRISGARVVTREFPPSETPRPAHYRDFVAGIPARERQHLPRSFDVIGDLVLVRLPRHLVPYQKQVGDALLRFVPGARQVGWDRGVEGAFRKRRLKRIAGSGGWPTTYRENGLSFSVDPSRAYFSPRLGREHAWVAHEARPGERVLDLCCGVAPFGLTIARTARPKSVVCVDANPTAIRLARVNAARLISRGNVRIVRSRVAAFLRRAGAFDRVVFNLPHEGIKYLPSVGSRVVRGGTLHYYEVTNRAHRSSRSHQLTRRLTSGPWRLVEQHVVHAYSPSSDLVEFSLQRE